jgi:hypothetical protein
MKETKQNLEAEEKAIAKAHVESILAGGSTDVYEALLREAKAKRTILEERLRVLEALNSNQMASQTEDEAEAIQGLVASVDEDLTVPELSDKEKHGLLTRIISSVQPQDEGVKITLRNAVGRTVENVVLSCGRYNSFGHPHSATLSRLAEQCVATFRTDIDGAIEIVSDGRACWVQTFR